MENNNNNNNRLIIELCIQTRYTDCWNEWTVAKHDIRVYIYIIYLFIRTQ